VYEDSSKEARKPVHELSHLRYLSATTKNYITIQSKSSPIISTGAQNHLIFYYTDHSESLERVDRIICKTLLTTKHEGTNYTNGI
jgi:hypothetical protein